MRPYIKSGYNQTKLTDTTENYIINGFHNPPGKMGVEYKDMSFEIQTEIDNNNLKEELKHIFFLMIITETN